MRTQHRHLNDLFSQARSENNVVSQQEIDMLLDAHELHGRQFDAESKSSLESHTIPKRGIVMGILSTLIVGGFIGVGTFFWNGDGKDTDRRMAEHQVSAAETEEHVVPDKIRQGMPTWSLLTADAAPTPFTTETSSRIALAIPVNTSTWRGADRPLYQKEEDDPEETVTDDATLQKEAEELGRQLGSFVTDYWYDRINSYRQFIDRSLGATDLAELNRLRVRWELLESDGTGILNFQLSNARTLNSDGNSISQTMSFSSNEGAEPEFISDVNVRKDSTSVHLILDGEDGTSMMNSMAMIFNDSDSLPEIAIPDIREIDIETDVDVEVKVDTDGEEQQTRKVITRVRKLNRTDDAAADESVRARTFTLDGLDEMPIENMLRMAISLDPSDRSAVLRETWKIADRNRSQLDDLKEQVLADVATFNRELSTHLRTLATSSDTKLAAKLSAALEDEEGLTEPMMQVLGPLYDVLAEPMLMLYNGSDITPVLSSAITEPVAGITLNGRSVLAQSYPNPANSHVTIDFTLPEASNAATLRLFDVNGNEVIRRDLGQLRSGMHSQELDLSALAAGTYLYHLTLESPEGNRVWSRTLEIVR